MFNNGYSEVVHRWQSYTPDLTRHIGSSRLVTQFVWSRGALALRYKSEETRRYSSTVTTHRVIHRVMETLRNTSYPTITTHSEKMCELNKISEQGWKKPEDNSRTGTEYSRIITDPNTGKCYCRGKVLGKVMDSILMLILFKIDVKIVIYCISACLHCFSLRHIVVCTEYDYITFWKSLYLG